MKFNHFVILGLMVAPLAMLKSNSVYLNVAIVAACVAGAIYLLSHFDAQEIDALPSLKDLEDSKAQLEAVSQSAQEEREGFLAMAEGMESALFTCAPDTTVRYANRAARELFNFERPNGRTFLAFTLCYDLHSFLTEAVAHPALMRKEIGLVYPTEMTVLASVWPQLDANGEATQFFVSLQNVTKLRKLEQIRRDFVANVSHELRTPLSSIRAMAETIIDDDQLEEDIRDKWLHTIINETERLTRIADDLLILAHTETQKPTVTLIDLSEAIEKALEGLKPRAKESGLRLNVDLQHPLPVEANFDQMQQVALNLIDNAIKYTPEGSVSVSGYIENDSVIFRVSDTGIGILSEDLPRLFERFYRVDKARSRATGGTGLGLSIVKHIIESNKGKVSVESEFRKGSSFVVTLPKAGGYIEPYFDEVTPADKIDRSDSPVSPS